MKDAIGLVETVGLSVAIAAADAGLKAAGVALIGFERANGAGMMVVKFQGDIGSIQAAVDAGADAAKQLNAFVIGHVIPGPAVFIKQ